MSFGQLVTAEQENQYNAFTGRNWNFMKFNNFFVIPTFSVLHNDNKTIEAIGRSSNNEFNDNPRLHILSYSGKIKENKALGVAVYQQEVGVFRDFGFFANYAHNIQMGGRTGLAIGFNVVYSNRGANDNDVISFDEDDEVIINYQNIPVINLQPAVTFTYSDFEIGVFFENIVDYNLKTNEMVTSFAEKTYTGHLGYSKSLENLSGLFEDTNIRAYAIGRTSQANGFTYGGNVLVDLPKAGWIKAGYDSFFGFNAGIGVNISRRLSIGFAFESNDNLGNTNEIGLSYAIGRKKSSSVKPNIEVIIPGEEEDSSTRSNEDIKEVEQNDLTDELEKAKDSISILNRRIEVILKKPTPQIIEEDRTETSQPNSPYPEELDTSLERSSKTPWRETETTKSGGGAGTMYYVALDQFKDLTKANALIEKEYRIGKARAKAKNLKAPVTKLKKVYDPTTKTYYVYEERYAKRDDAEEVKKEINVGGGFENAGNNDVDLDQNAKITKTVQFSKPVYVVKITLGAQGETYKVKKSQPKARIRNLDSGGLIETGYYIVVNVFSKVAYAHKFVDELRADGIDANYFINPNTGYRHVYIYKTYDSQDLINNYNSNLNGRYYDRKNLIHVR